MKNKYPEIRLSGYDTEWSMKKLGDITDIKDSSRISNALWISNGVPYLRSSDLSNDNIKGELFLSKKTYKEYSAKTGAPTRGDLLFTSGGKIGVTYYKENDDELYVQGGSILYAKTSESEHLDGRFLKTYFDTPILKKYIENASTGLTIKHFTLKPAKDTPIAIPGLDEQKKIGLFFKDLDDTISLHQQELDALKQTKQGFLQKMFPEEEESIPKVRLSKYSGQWRTEELGSLVNKIRSYSLSRDVETNSLSEYKYIHYGDIHKRVAKYIDNLSCLPNIQGGNYEWLEEGDLVLADASEDYQGIANAAILAIKPMQKVIAGLHTIALRPNYQKLNSLYLYYLLESSLFKKFGYKTGTGMKVFGINTTNLLKFNAIFPTIEEQSDIGDFFRQLDVVIELKEQELAALKQTKKGFLQKMFV